MWGLFKYREIVPQEKLVFVNSFSDEQGGVTRHPGSATWPLYMLSTFIFEDAPGGKTKFTVTWRTLDATDEEQKTFDTMHDSMIQGCGGTMDQLAAYLASTSEEYRHANRSFVPRRIRGRVHISRHTENASSAAIAHSATAVQRLRRCSARPIASTVSGDSTRPSRVMSSS